MLSPMSDKRARDKTVRIAVSTPGNKAGERRGTLTVLSENQLGRLIILEDPEVVLGRGDDASIRVDDESLSRRHVRIFFIHGGYFIEDLDSTNGTFLNGSKLTHPQPLEDGARIQLGDATLLRFSLVDQQEYEAARKLYESTVRDALTGVFNRYYLDEHLPSEFSYAKRHGTPLSILFVDADHFKQINDTHGHPAGDEVLRRLGAFLLSTVRNEDIVCRYGGEEFVVLVRGIHEQGIEILAERLRHGVEVLDITVDGKKIPVTVSVGVTTLSTGSTLESPTELLASADSALYRAKQNGRNRIEHGLSVPPSETAV